MSRINDSIASYFRQTNSLLYSYLICLPLLLLYEILIIISQPDGSQIIRISVDVWIKTLFSFLGSNVLSITLIVAAIAGIIILYKERQQLKNLKIHYFAWMLVEASIYAFCLALLISITVGSILQIAQTPQPMESLTTLQQLALSLGAGLYEELFFRVILVSILLYTFSFWTSKKWMAKASAIVLAAIIFSTVHYIGTMGDPFTVDTFLFRFLFGLALNGIYLWRGFGMAAWTHAIYDLMVVVYL